MARRSPFAIPLLDAEKEAVVGAASCMGYATATWARAVLLREAEAVKTRFQSPVQSPVQSPEPVVPTAPTPSPSEDAG